MTSPTVGSGEYVDRTTPPGTARTQRPDAATKPSTSSSRKSVGSLNSRVIAPPKGQGHGVGHALLQQAVWTAAGLGVRWCVPRPATRAPWSRVGGVNVRALVLADRCDLRGGGRVRVESVPQPLLRQPTSQLETDHPL